MMGRRRSKKRHPWSILSEKPFTLYICLLEKNEAHDAISRNANDPQQEEEDSEHVLDPRMVRRKCGPVRMGYCKHFLGSIVSVFGA